MKVGLKCRSVEKAVAALPDIVKKVKEACNVPGFAVAVVHGGKMIFDEGYGLRDNRDDASKVSRLDVEVDLGQGGRLRHDEGPQLRL